MVQELEGFVNQGINLHFTGTIFSLPWKFSPFSIVLEEYALHWYSPLKNAQHYTTGIAGSSVFGNIGEQKNST
jgi:hypothetical protein